MISAIDLRRFLVEAIQESDVTAEFLYRPEPNSAIDIVSNGHFYVENMHGRDAWKSIPGSLEFLESCYNESVGSLLRRKRGQSAQ